jgi:CheY-like chemotaxis protein
MAEILVIDDMSGVRRAVTAMLQRGGHKVTTANTGKEGLELLKERRFDLVITDILMPEMDGMEVLTYLSTLTNRPPMIAMSGGGAGISANEALGGANFIADAFIEKPFEKNDLLSIVEKLLGKAA